MILNALTFDLSKVTEIEMLISVIGYLIVFVSLVLLYYVFYLIPKILNFSIRKKLRKQGKIDVKSTEDLSVSGDVNAAISLALYLFVNQLHDEESGILTIKKVSKTYSPWSSKIYGLNNYYINKRR